MDELALAKLVNSIRARADLSPHDFEQLNVLGQGSYGTVVQVRYLGDRRHPVYALKCVSKAQLLNPDILKAIRHENQVHSSIDHPFIVKMIRCFQDAKNVNFLLEYVPGGELRRRLSDVARFSEEVSMFYASELLLALHYLHTIDVVFRDLKPENVLIDLHGHVKLADFGLAKTMDKDRTNTLCGTVAYMAPEMLLRHKAEGYGKSVDWWAFGVLLYEMLAGVNPFHNKDPSIVYKNVVDINYTVPSHFSPAAKNLIAKLFVKAEKRLGVADNGEAIMMDEFFMGVCFEALLKRQVEAPWAPVLSDCADVSYFKDQEFEVGSFVNKTLLTDDSDTLFEDFN